MSATRVLSDQEIRDILDETTEQYRQYAEVQEICELTEPPVADDYSVRNVNYPLGIVWQGRGDGVLERTP
jgi:hypothetical protein